jgi:hypothetical protein
MENSPAPLDTVLDALIKATADNPYRVRVHRAARDLFLTLRIERLLDEIQNNTASKAEARKWKQQIISMWDDEAADDAWLSDSDYK